MDPRRFDSLTKSLFSPGTRRGIIRLLAALPLGVVIASRVGDALDTTAKDDDHGSSHRRHRRKAKHRHQVGNNKDNRKGKRDGKRKNNQPGLAITAFTTSRSSIDRGATPAETATLSWTTSNATTCSINNGVGSVPCNGNFSVGPSATTTYTLSATGPGGGPVTAQTTVMVQYCHGIASTGHTCLTGNTEFCRSQPISATSSDDAKAACEACYGENSCLNDLGCGRFDPTSWTGPDGSDNAAFQYAFSLPGEILGGRGAMGAPGPVECAPTGARWAP